MAISQKNTRTPITISKELKAKLEAQAEKEHRTFAARVRHALIEYMEKAEKGENNA